MVFLSMTRLNSSLQDLQIQLEQQNKLMEQMQKARDDSSAETPDDVAEEREVRRLSHRTSWTSKNCMSWYLQSSKIALEEMYAQMVYKDKRLLELNQKLLDQEKQVLDVLETVHEKDEVIRGRDKAIKVFALDHCLL